MSRGLFNGVLFLFIILLFIFIFPNEVRGNESETLILRSFSEKVNLYPTIEHARGQQENLTIDDVSSDEFAKKFIHSEARAPKWRFFRDGYLDSF